MSPGILAGAIARAIESAQKRSKSNAAQLPERLSDIRERRRATEDLGDLPEDELERLIRTLEQEMRDAAVDLRFEYAARLRDEIKDLKRELREMR